MTLARTLIVCVSLALSAVSQYATAQELPANDRAAILELASDLEAGVLSGDFASTLDVLPPRLLREMVSQLGVTESELKSSVNAKVAELSSEVTFVSFSLLIDDATVAATPSRGRYLLIPTKTVLDILGVGRVVARSQTLAMEEDERWYLVRIEDQSQLDTLKTVYPEFEAIEVEPGTIEAAK